MPSSFWNDLPRSGERKKRCNKRSLEELTEFGRSLRAVHTKTASDNTRNANKPTVKTCGPRRHSASSEISECVLDKQRPALTSTRSSGAENTRVLSHSVTAETHNRRHAMSARCDERGAAKKYLDEMCATDNRALPIQLASSLYVQIATRVRQGKRRRSTR